MLPIISLQAMIGFQKRILRTKMKMAKKNLMMRESLPSNMTMMMMMKKKKRKKNLMRTKMKLMWWVDLTMKIVMRVVKNHTYPKRGRVQKIRPLLILTKLIDKPSIKPKWRLCPHGGTQ